MEEWLGKLDKRISVVMRWIENIDGDELEEEEEFYFLFLLLINFY